MRSLYVAAAELEAFLTERAWRYCFIFEQLEPLCELKGTPENIDRLQGPRHRK